VVEGSALIYPPGYCHFGRFLDDGYFKQLTAEFLDEESFRGRVRKVWKVRGSRENHFFDCRVGNLALANAYFIGLTADDWARIAQERGVPADLKEPDLFNPLARSRSEAAPAAFEVSLAKLIEKQSHVAQPDAAPAPQDEPSPDVKSRSHFDGLAELNRGL
jgi:phage terminase large subunit GpA-like protein